MRPRQQGANLVRAHVFGARRSPPPGENQRTEKEHEVPRAAQREIRPRRQSREVASGVAPQMVHQVVVVGMKERERGTGDEEQATRTQCRRDLLKNCGIVVQVLEYIEQEDHVPAIIPSEIIEIDLVPAGEITDDGTGECQRLKR